jgi:hypothetical protein
MTTKMLNIRGHYSSSRLPSFKLDTSARRKSRGIDLKKLHLELGKEYFLRQMSWAKRRLTFFIFLNFQ